MKVLIHPSNIERFKKLVSRASNYINIEVTYGDEYVAKRVWVHTSEGKEVNHGFTPIAVVPVIITIPNLPNGWQLIARREGDLWEWYGPALDNADLRKSYRATAIAPTDCQVCNTKQRRNETFVISKAEERLQVGGSCISQYIPTDFLKALSAISEGMTLVVNLDNPEFDGSSILGFADGWYEIKKVFRVLEGFKNEVYIPSKNTSGLPNPNATWRLVRETCNQWGHNEIAPNRIDIYYPFDALAFQQFIDFCKAEADMVRILEQEWCKSKDIAYMTGLHRRWQMSLNSDDCGGTVPTGRHSVSGKILSLKYVSTDFGETLKATVQCNGYKLYGSVPKSSEWKIGDTVAFTATLTPKETGFGFYSRPMVSK